MYRGAVSPQHVITWFSFVYGVLRSSSWLRRVDLESGGKHDGGVVAEYKVWAGECVFSVSSMIVDVGHTLPNRESDYHPWFPTRRLYFQVQVQEALIELEELLR